MGNNTATAKTEKTKSESGAAPRSAKFTSVGTNSSLDLNGVAGNLAVQRTLGGGMIQAKLSISQPDDPYEQEADRVADEVMRMPVSGAAPNISSNSPSVQRMCAGCEEVLEEKETAGALAVQRKMVEEGDDNEEDKYLQTKRDANAPAAPKPDFLSRLGSMKGGGQPLPSVTRAYFEPRFGRDLRCVRVHSDSTAAGLAGSIQARAFTTGHDIVFGLGHYAPETTSGQRLLAHELTHVIQQHDRLPRYGSTMRKLTNGEKSHDSVSRQGNSIASARQSRVAYDSNSQNMQRQPLPEGPLTPDPCKTLFEAIRQLVNKVAKRFNDALDDIHNLFLFHREISNPHPDGHGSWEGHRQRHELERKQLRNKVDDWDNDCHDFELLPDQHLVLHDAREFKEKKFPKQPLKKMKIEDPGLSFWDWVKILGISLGTAILIVAALADPEPASKLVLLGLSTAMISLILKRIGSGKPKA